MQKVLKVLFVSLLFTGIFYNQHQLLNRAANPHYVFIDWFANIPNTKQIDEIIISRDVGKYNNLISVSDNFRYFFLNTDVVYIDEELFDSDCIVNININDAVLIPKDDECYDTFTKERNYYEWSYKGEFTSNSNADLVLIQKK